MKTIFHRGNLFFICSVLFLLGAVVSPLCVCSVAYAKSGLDQLREAEVANARRGQIETSLANLEKYHLEHPNNIPLISDLIVLYSWNNNHETAIDLYGQRPPDSYPDYVHTTVIGSYRALGKSEQALEIVNFLLKRNIDDETILLKQIQLLVDIGRFEEAQQILDELSDANDLDADLHRVAGYLYTEKGIWVDALRQYQDVLAYTPNDPEAIFGKVNALINLGAPHAAAKHAASNEELFSIDTQVDILTTKAALLLRWSSHASENSEESLMLASRALILHLIALEMVPLDKQYEDLRRKIEYDMVIAFSYLRRYEDSYSLYVSLTKDDDIPTYVSFAAAQSLLALRQPSKSLEILEKVLEEEPGNYNAKLTLFYAYIENEEFSKAKDLIDTAIKQTPKFKRFSDSQVQHRNDERLELEILASQARLYADQLADAWSRISMLKNMAPANDWLAHVSGETALARGWSREAFTNFQGANRLNPDNFSALEGMAQSHIRLHNYRDAQRILNTLKEDHPAESSTERLEKDLFWAQRPTLWADLELSYSEGPEQSGDGITATGELISSPISQYLHLSLQGRYAWSEIPEGEESLTRYGGGLELIDNPFSLLALINYNESTINEVGGLLRGIWTPDDHWSLTLQGDRFSEATPLRALYYGIREDQVSGSAGYRWHEGSALAFNLNSGWFTDDNHRIEGGLRYTGRFVDIPKFDCDGALEIYGSTNSLDDAPYYNPKSDLSIKGTVKGEHLLYRFYDKALVQQISAGLGVYAQENYNTGAIGSLRYELRYNYHPRIEAALGGELGRNRYDGEDEPYYKFNFLIHAKF